jgi:hypothetical protein
MEKDAEPPPPKGVSVKEWDKMLQKAPIQLIRRASEKLAFDTLYDPPPPQTEEVIASLKLAAVADVGLYDTAAAISSGVDEALDLYEKLGGVYKHAFGQRMFDTPQLAGSPALAGGMQQRSAATPAAPAGMQTTRTAGGPQAPKAPGTAQQGQTSAPSLTSATSAPSTPAVTVSTG